MKKGLAILFLFFSSLSFSQITLEGSVVSSDNKPLEGASVYFNNTTIGTITNANGKFNLKVKEGNYLLIVSFLGYQTKQLSINSKNKNQKIKVILEEETNVLNEVIVKKIVYDHVWKNNLIHFKRAFLGKSAAAQKCKILNEKDLYFSYDHDTNTFKAFSKKKLLIKNKELGYIITYDLVDFIMHDDKLFFSGYAQFKDLRKKVRSKYHRNRIKAFNGSRMHFLRSLLEHKTEKEGFIIHQFNRIKNPERPTDEAIELARKVIKPIYHKVDFNKTIIQPKTKIDSALITLKKASLPRFIDYITRKNVSDKNILQHQESVPYLDFKNFLSIIYKYEPEEYNYLKTLPRSQRKGSGVQTSNIVLLNGKTPIDAHGILEPRATLSEGYWGFEAIGEMLPLDYQPKKN
ncbi:conserved exported protein of unknown function [Tenacibaculum sp. 190130A14a]|uniref:Carboxypeptidase-like protein n=1 Tax=Tenacibaculum polynesiense TaxID=3137857 RepID=A0ABM9PD72_9FLAO